MVGEKTPYFYTVREEDIFLKRIIRLPGYLNEQTLSL